MSKQFLSMSLDRYMSAHEVVEMWNDFQHFIHTNPFAAYARFDMFGTMNHIEIADVEFDSYDKADTYIMENTEARDNVIAALTPHSWVVGGYIHNPMSEEKLRLMLPNHRITGVK